MVISLFLKPSEMPEFQARKSLLCLYPSQKTELAEFNINEMIGDYGAQIFFKVSTRPANHKFVERFKKKYGADRAISSSMKAPIAAYTFGATL